MKEELMSTHRDIDSHKSFNRSSDEDIGIDVTQQESGLTSMFTRNNSLVFKR